LRLVHYFLRELPEDAVLTEQHRKLLEKYITRQRKLDWFLGRTDLKEFMQRIPKYHKGGLHR